MLAMEEDCLSVMETGLWRDGTILYSGSEFLCPDELRHLTSALHLAAQKKAGFRTIHREVHEHGLLFTPQG